MNLNIENLAIGFEDNLLFNGLNIHLHDGETLAVLGCNGTGKSSFLATIAGNIPAKQGSINFQNKNYKSNIGYLTQSPNITKNLGLNIYEFIELGFLARNSKCENKSDAIHQALLQTGLEDKKNQKFDELSGGQKIRAFIARLIVQDPQIIILDEPYAALDTESKNLITEIIKVWKSKNKIIIISIHDERLALDFDHFLTLDGKKAWWERREAKHARTCELAHSEI